MIRAVIFGILIRATVGINPRQSETFFRLSEREISLLRRERTDRCRPELSPGKFILGFRVNSTADKWPDGTRVVVHNDYISCVKPACDFYLVLQPSRTMKIGAQDRSSRWGELQVDRNTGGLVWRLGGERGTKFEVEQNEKTCKVFLKHGFPAYYLRKQSEKYAGSGTLIKSDDFAVTGTDCKTGTSCEFDVARLSKWTLLHSGSLKSPSDAYHYYTHDRGEWLAGNHTEVSCQSACENMETCTAYEFNGCTIYTDLGMSTCRLFTYDVGLISGPNVAAYGSDWCQKTYVNGWLYPSQWALTARPGRKWALENQTKTLKLWALEPPLPPKAGNHTCNNENSKYHKLLLLQHDVKEEAKHFFRGRYATDYPQTAEFVACEQKAKHVLMNITAPRLFERANQSRHECRTRDTSTSKVPCKWALHCLECKQRKELKTSACGHIREQLETFLAGKQIECEEIG